MANSFFNDDDNQILEGFLCPICHEDLKTPERLTEHVEKIHADEQDVLKSIKDIFSKAKRKIKLNFDETVDLAKSIDNNLKINNTYHTNFLNTTPQEVGADCSHFSYFNSVRTPRLERYASETNKLIIRLHKLLKNRPTDPIQQKLHDQKTVPWLDGTSVKLCPNCAKSFHIARRQHHCRLCGSIMCNDCSKFLDYEDAKNLISIASSENDEEIQSSNKSNDSNSVRTCEHCIHLLDARKEMQDSRTCRPPIVKLYNDIQELKKEIRPDIEVYKRMINSLYEGDSIFTIADVSALKAKIGRAAEIIDLKTKQILALSNSQQQHQQQEQQVNIREESLKKSIRMANVKFIKDEMLSIPPIPVEDEIRKIQEKRRKETEQRIERERRLALEAYEKYGLVESNSVYTVNSNFASGSAVATLDNWSGTHQVTSNINDPLVEQINIIKSYIKQARAAMRFDEVATLELNLRELQNELYQRHHNQQPN